MTVGYLVDKVDIMLAYLDKNEISYTYNSIGDIGSEFYGCEYVVVGNVVIPFAFVYRMSDVLFANLLEGFKHATT